MSLLEVKDLKVYFPIRGGVLGRTQGWVKAVDGVSFTIDPGQTLGLVGESGSGKSTTGKAILGLTPIISGSIRFDGEDITKYIGKNRSAYRQSVQMIFQDAYSSLNPRKRVHDIIAEPIRNFEKLTKKEEKYRIDELLRIVGLTERAAVKYPHEFSGGQRQRIGIARAIALKPKLIVADEPVSALDLSVQAQVLNYLKDIQQELKLAYLFVSHDLGVVKHMCETLAIMHNSRFVEFGTRNDIYKNAQHIYTRRLIAAIPDVDPNLREQNAKKRADLTEEYKKEHDKFYDKKGGVYDLRAISETHSIAVPYWKGFMPNGEHWIMDIPQDKDDVYKEKMLDQLNKYNWDLAFVKENEEKYILKKGDKERKAIRAAKAKATREKVIITSVVSVIILAILAAAIMFIFFGGYEEESSPIVTMPVRATAAPTPATPAPTAAPAVVDDNDDEVEDGNGHDENEYYGEDEYNEEEIDDDENNDEDETNDDA